MVQLYEYGETPDPVETEAEIAYPISVVVGEMVIEDEVKLPTTVTTTEAGVLTNPVESTTVT